MFDRARAEFLAVHLRDRAELASQRAAAAGLDDVGGRELPVIAEKLLAWHWEVTEVNESVGVVDRLETAAHEIGHEFIPNHLDLVNHYSVEMLSAFPGHESRVAAPANRPNAPIAKVIGQIVPALCLAGHHSDPNQFRRLIKVERLELFLDDLDLFEVGRGQSGDHGQVEMMSVFGAFEALNLEAFRRDKK